MVKTGNWKNGGDLQAKGRKGDGRITDPRGVNYRITKLTANSKPQEKRGEEIQWLPAVECTVVKEVLAVCL